MYIIKCVVFICLLAFFIAPGIYALEENPESCNCETVDVTPEEEATGCPANIKRETCPLYRETQVWKERLRQQQEQRRLEKRMETPQIPR